MKNFVFFPVVVCLIIDAIVGEMAKSCEVYQPSQPVGVYLPAIVSTETIVENDWKVDLIFGVVYLNYRCARFYTEGEHVVVSTNQNVCEKQGMKVTRWRRETFGNSTELYISKTEDRNVKIRLLNGESHSFHVDDIYDKIVYLSIGPQTTSPVIFNCPWGCPVKFGDLNITPFRNSGFGSTYDNEFYFYSFKKGNLMNVQLSGCYYMQSRNYSFDHHSSSWNHIFVGITDETIQVKLNDKQMISSGCFKTNSLEISIYDIDFWTMCCQPEYLINVSVSNANAQGLQYNTYLEPIGIWNPPSCISEDPFLHILPTLNEQNLHIEENVHSSFSSLKEITPCTPYHVIEKELISLPTVISLGSTETNWTADLHFGKSFSEYLCIHLCSKRDNITFSANENACESDGFNVTSRPKEPFGAQVDLYITREEAGVIFDVLNTQSKPFTIEGKFFPYLIIPPTSTVVITFNCPVGCHMEFGDSYMQRFSDDEGYLGISYYSRGKGETSLHVKRSPCYDVKLLSLEQLPDLHHATLNYIAVGVTKNSIHVELNDIEIISYKSEGNCPGSSGTEFYISEIEFWMEGCRPYYTYNETTKTDLYASVLFFETTTFDPDSCKAYGPNENVSILLPTVISINPSESKWTINVFAISHEMSLCIRIHFEYEHINATAKECGSDTLNVPNQQMRAASSDGLTELYISKDEGGLMISEQNGKSYDPMIIDYNTTRSLPLSIVTHATSSIMFNCPGDCKVKFGDVNKTEMFSRGNPFGVSFYSNGRITGSSLRLFDFHFDSEEDFVLDQLPDIFKSSWNHLVISIVDNIIKVQLNKREIRSYEIEISWPRIYSITLSIIGTEFWTEGCHPQHPMRLSVKLSPDKEDYSESLGFENT